MRKFSCISMNCFMQARAVRGMIVCVAQTELMKFNNGVIIRRAKVVDALKELSSDDLSRLDKDRPTMINRGNSFTEERKRRTRLDPGYRFPALMVSRTVLG